MKTTQKHAGFGRKVMALAIVAAFGHAHADDDVADLTQPGSSVSAGVAVVNGDKKDRSIFGQYNGLRDHKGNALLDLDLVKRDNATGTWMILKGRNLGLDNRELNATFEKQGDWKVNAGYNQITHHEIRTVNTGDTGVGTTTPTVVRLATPGTGSDLDFKIERKEHSLAASKWFTPHLQLEASFKNEDKDGTRMSGKGYDCRATTCVAAAGQVDNVILMQAEPINFNTKQFELRLNFVGDKLSGSAGYYGSFFKNSNGSINMTVPPQLNNGNGVAATLATGAGAGGVAPPGGFTLQNILQLPFALPPDNQAHQFYVNGNYAFTKKTKATFKFAHTRATQDEGFAGMGLTGAPAGASNLNGRVDSTLAQVGLTAKPLPKLSLLGNIRYEKKSDKTPKYLYNMLDGRIWQNGSTSNSRLAGKFEASYQLPASFRGTLGIDYNKLEREVPTNAAVEEIGGVSAMRRRTNELGYRLELSRVMSETLSGTIGYATSKRRGSDWTSLNTTTTASVLNAYCGGVTCYGQSLPDTSIWGALVGTTSTATFPVSMADMDRDKWKLGVDWNPTQRLSLQFLVEDGKDKNTSSYNAVAGGKGFRKNDMKLYSVDASFAVSDTWKLVGYASRGEQTLNINHSTGYMLDLDNTTDTFGIGATGKVGRFEVGAGLSHLNDKNKYGIQAAGSTTGAAPSATNLGQAAVGLPDVVFKQTALSLYGKTALDKHSDLRVDLIHQRNKLDEWSWGYNGVPFIYGDNTTVKLQQEQNVTYIGARYIYKWR